MAQPVIPGALAPLVQARAQPARQCLRQHLQRRQAEFDQQWRCGLLHLHIGMRAGPITRHLAIEQFDQPAWLTQARTDVQHADHCRHRLCAKRHGPQEMRRGLFAGLFSSQPAFFRHFMAASWPTDLAGTAEAVKTHHHMRVICLGAGVDPRLEGLRQGLAALSVPIQQVALHSFEVNRAFTRWRLQPLRLERIEKAVKLSVFIGLHPFSELLAGEIEGLHGQYLKSI